MNGEKIKAFIYTLILIFCACSLFNSAYAATSIAYTCGKVAGIKCSIVTVNLNDPDIRLTPAISRYGVGTCESFRSILRRTRPAAAINGTFFCTRTFRPIGDIVIDGNLIAKGYLGMPILIGQSGVSFLLPNSDSIYRNYSHDHILVAGPTLLYRGAKLVSPRSQGFRSSVHFTRRIRSAIGITSNNKLVMVITRRGAYLSELARVMAKLKCVDAAVLDGGSSTGLYWKGKLIANPSRSMTNCLLVYDSPSVYEKKRRCFYPVTYYSSRPADADNSINIKL